MVTVLGSRVRLSALLPQKTPTTTPAGASTSVAPSAWILIFDKAELKNWIVPWACVETVPASQVNARIGMNTFFMDCLLYGITSRLRGLFKIQPRRSGEVRRG